MPEARFGVAISGDLRCIQSGLRATPSDDLFRARLSHQLDRRHPLVRLAGLIEWNSFDAEFGLLYHETLGRPGKPTRLMVALTYLKHCYNLSDEQVCERWVENPYWQFFCGFDYLQHRLPIDPSSLTRWRERIGASGMERLGLPRNGGHRMISSKGSEVTNGNEDPAIIYGRVQTGGGVTADIEWSTTDAGGERVGIQPSMLRHWRDDRQANGTVTRIARSPSSDGMSAEHAEIRRLEKELARAQMEPKFGTIRLPRPR